MPGWGSSASASRYSSQFPAPSTGSLEMPKRSKTVFGPAYIPLELKASTGRRTRTHSFSRSPAPAPTAGSCSPAFELSATA